MSKYWTARIAPFQISICIHIFYIFIMHKYKHSHVYVYVRLDTWKKEEGATNWMGWASLGVGPGITYYVGPKAVRPPLVFNGVCVTDRVTLGRGGQQQQEENRKILECIPREGHPGR